MKRIYHPTQDGPFLLNLNPKIIGWKYLSFQVARLTQDQTLQDDSKSEEVVALPVQNGDVVVIHEGYHPVVNAPGTNTYYLNFLAGDVRKISAVNDPNYDWVGTHWEGNPIEIPLQR